MLSSKSIAVKELRSENFASFGFSSPLLSYWYEYVGRDVSSSSTFDLFHIFSKSISFPFNGIIDSEKAIIANNTIFKMNFCIITPFKYTL